ncbi:hypothetical protein [Rhizobium sp. BK176]|uniref:hypothetical protein n=1 Tax=Rhizobium sp. BK176 TaxID=2587071 RepID=UPI002168F4C0|nr:hypothetical protein [Rhizobium sp. BK176]MCS4090232.1 hypothetical protein [Rhizobium sp. BK176]
MDAVQRFDKVADYLLECFSNGQETVSKHDVIDDAGTVLSTEAFAVLDEIRESGVSIGDGKAVEALDTFVQAWSQGYDLASGNDLTDDDEAVSAVLSAYRSAKPAVAPAGPRL